MTSGPPSDRAADPGVGGASTAAPTQSLQAGIRRAILREVEKLARGATFDRYVVLDELGSGGMGHVYAAYDGKLDRRVALKVLRHESEAFEARLTREAQAMARLSHPNVVAVFDAGAVGDRLFVAMEFVEGTTLRKWQRAAARDWRELLRVYEAAGHGLAAAHAAGLVHRDFKPDNVLVSESGQVKVADFGIVRAIGETGPPGADGGAASRPVLEALGSRRAASDTLPEEPGHEPAPSRAPAAPPSGSSLGTPMTELGDLVGTPGYMAPEQYLGDTIDARTDQFSFCVALYEALYGAKPFDGQDGLDIARATIEGALRPPPKATSVPSRLWRVLRRGLSTEGADRYPSMDALLLDLLDDPARRRRRIAGVAATVAIVGAMGVWTLRATSARRAELCSGAEAEANAVWSSDTRENVERALLGTGVLYAADTARRTRELLDDYMRRWTEMHRQTCEATRVQGHQSEQVMTVRMACLEQRRDEVGALTRVLSAADRDVVAKALQAALALSPLEECKNTTSLMALAPEPADPAARAEIGAIRKELAEVKETRQAGKYAAARDRAEPLVERASRVGYAPLTARALLLAAGAGPSSGGTFEASIEQAERAEFEADVGRDDVTRAEAAINLVEWTTEVGHYGEAARWSKVADAALRRTGDDGDRRADWYEAVGTYSYRQGKYEDSRRANEEALALARRGSNLSLIAEIERDLAGTDAELGRAEDAARLIADADATIVRALGEEHPVRLRFLDDRGFVASKAGDMVAAADFAVKVVALGSKVAPEGTSVVNAYVNACFYITDGGHAETALPYCEGAVARCLKKYGSESGPLAYAYVAAAGALVEVNRPDEALDDVQKAIAIFEKTDSKTDPAYTEAFLLRGRAQLEKKQAPAAVATLEHALDLSTKVEAHSAEDLKVVAEARRRLAEALWQGGARPPRIAELARASIDGFVQGKDARDAAAVKEWLAAHDIPGAGSAGP
jgi:tetratricopeptide (TPR) repeat protein/predicted Ser/Thr protein kinase